MSIQHYGDKGIQGYQRMPGPGYTAHFKAGDNTLLLQVDELTDVHYIAQPQLAVSETAIRFKSGELFSVPMTFDELQSAVRAGEPFRIVPIPSAEGDLRKATVSILDRNPQRAIIDVGCVHGIDMAVSLAAADGPNGRILISDSAARCIAEPGALRSTRPMDDNTAANLKAWVQKPSLQPETPAEQPRQAQA